MSREVEQRGDLAVPAEGSLRTLVLIAAVLSMGFATHIHNGSLGPEGIKLLIGALGLTALGVVIPASSARAWAFAPVALIAMALQLSFLSATIYLYSFAVRGVIDAGLFIGMVTIAALLAGAMWFAEEKVARRLLGAMLLLHVAVGVWIIHFMPFPPIDVYIFQQGALEALLGGENPYAIMYPDPYRAAESAQFYGPGVSVGGVLQFGYPYLPLTLLMALPGYLLSDVRYADLLALTASAILIATARPGRVSRLAAVLLLFTPQFTHVLSQSWTEPLSILLLAGVYFCFYRARRVLPYVAGLLLVSKQYMVLALPLLLLLQDEGADRKMMFRFMGRALVAALAVTLPLVLWDVPAFMRSAVTLQFRQPFRPDSLSLLAWLEPKNPQAWMWLPFALAAGGAALALYARRRARVGFAGAMALVMLLFFAVNKQAFANYYFLVIGALCIAVAESASPIATSTESARPGDGLRTHSGGKLVPAKGK